MGNFSTIPFPLKAVCHLVAYVGPKCSSRITWTERSVTVLAVRHGSNVGQRVLTCSIDEINGFTRQFGQANCYEPFTNPFAKNGFKDRFMTFCVQ
ncbi:hypothetical protein Y032_0060g3134 [Ancylostoma ceylanicum]|uniref:Uncharacterized protein n=1 Tax=Ancylostoma ceylanicum TaxID=53326 RepID=A0A016U4C7_9BILA|nr:hypothetical protein Y032_0060g3134 [Ancylostoma ceylanicum]